MSKCKNWHRFDRANLTFPARLCIPQWLALNISENKEKSQQEQKITTTKTKAKCKPKTNQINSDPNHFLCRPVHSTIIGCQWTTEMLLQSDNHDSILIHLSINQKWRLLATKSNCSITFSLNLIGHQTFCSSIKRRMGAAKGNSQSCFMPIGVPSPFLKLWPMLSPKDYNKMISQDTIHPVTFFSCPGQLNRWPCHWLSDTFWF